jgi:hypothetical protein
VPQSTWTTAPAALALSRLGREPARVRAAVGWLTAREGLHADPGLVARAYRFLTERQAARVNELDGTIPGWPWIDGTFSWVEPTSLAVLALRAARRDPVLARDDALGERLRDGERLLVDRVCPGGGWNYGNKRVFEVDLEPYPDTTAWALMALRGAPGTDPVVRPSLARLGALLRDNRSPLARALAVCALAAHGRPDSDLAGALAAQCLGERPPADTRTRALALVALAAPTVLVS